MAANKLNIYLWLLNTLSASRITREEIDRRWAHCRYNEKRETSFPERKFYRYRNDIQELFDIDIQCKQGYYFIDQPQGGMNDPARKWMLNALAVHSLIEQTKDLREYILYEEIPSGTEYLSLIAEAIQSRTQLYLHYNTRYSDAIHPLHLKPYCLKAFKQRWYVVGEPDDHPGEIRIYSLDRVTDMQPTELPFTYPNDFSPEAFFEPYYGVFRNANPTTVRIAVNDISAKYLRSLQLHPSQTEVGFNPNQGYIFEYHIAPTFDFIQELRTFGSDIQVLSPDYLVQLFRDEATQLSKLYLNNNEQYSQSFIPTL